MAERDQLGETLKTQEEKHKIALHVLCKERTGAEGEEDRSRNGRESE